MIQRTQPLHVESIFTLSFISREYPRAFKYDPEPSSFVYTHPLSTIPPLKVTSMEFSTTDHLPLLGLEMC